MVNYSLNALEQCRNPLLEMFWSAADSIRNSLIEKFHEWSDEGISSRDYGATGHCRNAL